MKKRPKKKRSEMAQKLGALIEARGEGQVGFSRRVGTTQSRVSEWLAGKQSPTPEALIKIGNIAPHPDRIWFWKRAGLDEQSMLSEAAGILKEGEAEAKVLEGKKQVFLIPRFRETAQGREEAGPPVPLPAEFIPNHASTICLLVDEKATGMMSSPDGLFLVDTSVESAEDLQCLWGAVVFVDYRPLEITSGRQGVCVGRPKLRDRSEYRRFGPPLVRHADLNLLFDGSWIPLGGWEHPSYDQFSTVVGPAGSEELERLETETDQRAPSEFRLEKGIRILGRVIGRLTGHILFDKRGVPGWSKKPKKT